MSRVSSSSSSCCLLVSFLQSLSLSLSLSLGCSVFDSFPIPYPARKFLTDDDNKDDKGDHKVSTFQHCCAFTVQNTHPHHVYT